MDIQTIIKNRRIELGLTMLDVAKQVGVSEGTISRWESGNIANMRRDKIAALAKTLKLSPSVIMGWSNDECKSSDDSLDPAKNNSVGECIKKLRINEGFSQEELGKRLGVQRAAVQKWESGQVQSLKRDIIKKLATIFNVPPALFIDVDSTNLQTHLGEVIRNKRIELGLTIHDLAKQVGISENTILRLESGNIANMRINEIAVLAKALQLSPSVIIERSNDESDSDNSFDSSAESNKKLPDILYRYDELSADKQQEVVAFIEFKLAQQEKQKEQEEIKVLGEKAAEESKQYELKKILGYLDEQIAKGEFDPLKGQIAAYDGDSTSLERKQAERVAEIKRLAQLIEDEQSGNGDK